MKGMERKFFGEEIQQVSVGLRVGKEMAKVGRKGVGRRGGKGNQHGGERKCKKRGK